MAPQGMRGMAVVGRLRGYAGFLTRRGFLSAASAAGAAAAAGRLPWASAGDATRPAKRKTLLSFYCDDTYDLMPNAMDHFGIWENNPRRVDPDYYLAADGKSGILIRHVQAGAPYAIWYAHWQGLNPAKGVGWRAFTTVVDRIGKHLAGRVVWMRPSEITDRYHQAGGWGFLDAL